MLLGDILKLLKANVTAFGYNETNFFTLIFQSIFNQAELTNYDGYTHIYKNKRGLSLAKMNMLVNKEGFNKFCIHIRDQYVSMIGNDDKLNRNLKTLIEDDRFLNQERKQALLRHSEVMNKDNLARLISACIICGSYHVSLNKEKAYNYDCYCLGFEFMDMIYDHVFASELWTMAKKNYEIKQKKGSFHILDHLLPKGTLEEVTYDIKGKDMDGNIQSVMELVFEIDDNIAIVGEGGIGKTTFLQHLLEKAYGNHNALTCLDNTEIPIFIELRQCPKQIIDWYQDGLKKTDFITRYIGAMLENHYMLYDVKNETLNKIEKEFQKIEQHKPRYLLLLDGFNEVIIDGDSMRGTSVRSLLSNEIKILSSYPNVKIITTSRHTQSAYYIADFSKITLLGLEKKDIKYHLESAGFKRAIIGQIFAHESLLACLRIPLFLCMFSQSEQEVDMLPQTQGEILYNFFHQKTGLYSIKKRMDKTNTNPLSELETDLVMDFILPYIGWCFEESYLFSVCKEEIREIIHKAMDQIEVLFATESENPFLEFSYSNELIWQSLQTLKEKIKNKKDIVLECIQDYLGICYQFISNSMNQKNKIQYGFIHHHFRDYFSAMFVIQILRILRYIKTDDFHKFSIFVNDSYWAENRVEFLSQILLEHRNKPYYNKLIENWDFAKIIDERQNVLIYIMEVCRSLQKQNKEYHYILSNTLSAILIGRKEFSGLDLSNLNLESVNFFNITCMRKCKQNRLITNFKNSKLSYDSFQPRAHLSLIIEYLYYEHVCFTIDDIGYIKCWDTKSGKLEYTLFSENPSSIYIRSDKGNINITKNGRFLFAKSYPLKSNYKEAFLHIFDLHDPKHTCKRLRDPNAEHKVINCFSITEDDCYVFILYDKNILCCYDIKTVKLKYKVKLELLDITQVYAKSYDIVYFHTRIDELIFENDEEIENISVIMKYDNEKQCIEDLYTFCLDIQSPKSIEYCPLDDCFVLYNVNTQHIERLYCDESKPQTIYEEINKVMEEAPWAIYSRGANSSEVFFIYRTKAFLVNIRYASHPLLMYDLEKAVEKQFSTDNNDYFFYAACKPNRSHFIIWDSVCTYEWDLENEIIRERYNDVNYECRGLISDKIHNLIIHVHAFNGLTIFDGASLLPINVFCFTYTDYEVTKYSYHEKTQFIVLAFEKVDHSFIKYINLITGESEIIFSTFESYYNIRSIVHDKTGTMLLVCTNYSCYIYDFHTNSLKTVAKTSENERFAEAHFINDSTFDIAVVEDYIDEKLKVIPRVDVFKVYNKGFEKVAYYEMLVLESDNFSKFVHRFRDIGTGCGFNEKNENSYYVTRGFFIDITDIHKILVCHYNENKLNREYHDVLKYSFMYVYHYTPMENRVDVTKQKYCYTMLDESFEEALLIYNYEKIMLFSNIKQWQLENTYDYKESDDYEGGCIIWEDVVYLDEKWICCFENYRLLSIEFTTKKMNEILYEPGVAIQGCIFYDIQADDDTIAFIRENGGDYDH